MKNKIFKSLLSLVLVIGLFPSISVKAATLPLWKHMSSTPGETVTTEVNEDCILY